jgi:VWFA-related protein
VLIEVYARDRKGNPIRDLAIGDLTLKIDQQTRPKPIVSLEWIEPPPGALPLPGGPPPEEPPAPEGAAGPAPPSAGAAPARSARGDWPRRFLLFFDDATSSPIQMTNARRSVIALLDRPGLPTDQFGLASYSQKRRLEILHDFTSDRAALRAVLERSINDNVRMSDYASERIERNAAIERKRQEANQSEFAEALNGEAAGMARSYAGEDAKLMGRVLTALRTLVDAITPWPGYKAVVYVGEGVPENPATDYALNDPRLALTPEIGGLAMSAGSANVTLHSVQTDGVAAGTAGEVGAASRRSNALATLALDTGGVQVASNDLLGAFDTVERAAEGYYLLAYAPEGPPDGRYHTVNIKLDRKGILLRYRRGFTRYLPSEARTRAIQAAYVAPELHGDMRLDLAAVRGPAAGNERLFDLVLYLPPGQVLFLPQAGGPAARLEVGIVAIDQGGRETLRLARRVLLTPDAARAGADRPLAIDFFSRVRLPDRSQTIIAVVADVQSGAIGATRLAYESTGATAGATGVSLYSLDERSLWVEVDPKPGDRPDEERPMASTIGPALRTRFAPWERVSCGFRTPPPPPAGAPELRLVVLRGDEVVRTHTVEDEHPEGRADPTMHDADLPIAGLADGEYVLRIDEMRPGGAAEIGRARFSIGPPAPG